MTDFHEDIGAYLLSALSPAEAEAFERELEHNPDLRAEVDYLRVAAEALPASPIQIAPPSYLKDRVMATVNADAALFRAAQAPPEPSTPRRRGVAVLRPGWWSLRPGMAMAATLLVLVLGGVGGIVLSNGDGSQVISVANAKLIQRGSGHSTLTAAKLESPSPGHVYQVWLLHKGDAQPKPTNALFSARRDGTASVDVPGSLKNVKTVLVTEEPEGGSQTPTTDPVIEVHPA